MGRVAVDPEIMKLRFERVSAMIQKEAGDCMKMAIPLGLSPARSF